MLLTRNVEYGKIGLDYNLYMEVETVAEKTRKTIAIIIGNAISSYSIEMMEGFQACARRENLNLVFFTGPYLSNYYKDILTGSFSWDYEYQFHTIYDYVHYLKPDAIIVAYGLLSTFKYVPDIDEFVKHFEGIPCMVLGDKVKDPNIPSLTGGTYIGMRACIEHLVDVHGYKKIGFVAGPERNFDSNQRMKAYKDVLTERGIPVEESLIVHGNYTEMVDEQVEQLLDQNPGIEAIAFANDNMAKAGYRVCAARDLVVGHDIAFTGYDDSDVAKTLEPPLASVAHSSFAFSYSAVQMALKLCNGEKPESMDLEPQFQKRASCGCKTKTVNVKPGMTIGEIKTFVEERAAEVTEELFTSLSYEKEKEKYRALMELYFSDIVDMVFVNKEKEISSELLIRYLKRMCENPFISKRLVVEYIEQVLDELVILAEDKRTYIALMNIRFAMQQYMHAEEMNRLEMANINSERKNWFIPVFTMDLMYSSMEMQEQMKHILKRLQAMNIKSAYLLFFRKEVVHRKDEKMEYPDTIYLTAYYDEQKMVCNSAKELVPIKWGEGFANLLPQNRAHSYMAFPLFSGEEQYGMLLCEADNSEYMFTLICSMQLGSLRRVINLNIRERIMKQELEEKNRILSVISAYDELSQLLNRRGFMEKAMQIIKKNTGRKAYLMFADIDHLKEINDSFGHAAGDFAIQTAAEYLRHCMPADAVIARIGGDEYVALIVTEDVEADCGEILTKRLERYAIDFNKSCTQPFYVEMSAGVYEFNCEKDTDLSEILKYSDKVLYEQKKKRRATIKKQE